MEKTRIIFTKILWVLLLASITRFGYSNTADYSILVKNLDETLACNDSINVSVDESCVAVVKPDQLLEGDYPDYGIFVVSVFDHEGVIIGDTLRSDRVGESFYSEVRDTVTGNKCKSIVTVVDKIGPTLLCSDIYTTCSGELEPGSSLPHNFKFEFKPEVTVSIPDDDTLIYDLSVGNVPKGRISDLDVELNISHNDNSQLAAFLVSPSGDTVWLFKDLNCSLDGFNVRFDDQAKKTSTQFTNDCSDCCPEKPGVRGRYKPLQNLHSFNGDYLTGKWKIGIVDKASGNTGTLNYVNLLFKQNGGKLSFPIPETSSNPVKKGNKKYLIEEGFDSCGAVTLIYEDKFIDQDCSSDYTQIVERSWKATDESGNTTYCSQKIYFIRTGTSFLKFPPNYDGIDRPMLSCTRKNPNTGSPQSELCDDVTIAFEDDTIPGCSGSYKIYRNWKISEECSPDVIEHTQIISFIDNRGPEIASVKDTTISTDGLECSKDISIKFPEFSDACSDDDSITISVGYQELDEDSIPLTKKLLTDDLELISVGNYVLHASTGLYKITYTAVDHCGNVSTVSNIIGLRDDSPPVAVCQEHTQVSINLVGKAKVKASSFDDGSHDNCSDVTLKVRRMEPVCDAGDSSYRDTINFCCEDVNTTQWVELLVSDGINTNTCMVEVFVVDKIRPEITCPNDTTINCFEDYEQVFGNATARDNCGTKEITSRLISTKINQCNTGYVVRRWQVEDDHGHSDYCDQKITIVDNHIFSERDIIWPSDKKYFDCSENFDTSVTGTVRYKNEDFCSIVSARYYDEPFNVVEGACLKILRHWEVIDWCHYDNDDPKSIWTHTQTISLVNTKAPEFVNSCSSKTFYTYDGCGGLIDYEKKAEDDCTKEEDLNWTYYIDTNLDGKWDIGPVDSNRINGTFKNGVYKVAWTVEDGCGNKSTCEERLYVKDGKKPTPLCITKLSTAVMNEFGEIEICAEKFNLGQNCDNCPTGSYDNCTPNDKLKFSFSPNVKDVCRTYTCDSIPNGQFVYKTLSMYVTDEAGNFDYCNVVVRIEDNEASACDDSEEIFKPLISGLVYDPNYKKIENVEMSLSSIEGQNYTISTDETGTYSFNDIDKDTDFELRGNYNSNYIDGVSTLDIVLIQKHILGISKFKTPEKLIAADVNFSKSITAADILIIRKAILGIREDFGKNGRSWTLIADNENYRSSGNVLHSWDESINVAGNIQNQEQNWVGIKMADINGSSYEELESRSNDKALIYTQEIRYKANEEIEVPFTFENINKILGGQLTLNFDISKLTFVNVIPNENLINSGSFGLNKVDKGSLTLSWIKPNIDITSDEVLFTVVFKTNYDGDLSQSIYVGDNVTKAEAYNTKYEVMDVELQMRNDEEGDYNSVKLYANTPNPFNGKTKISFELPKNQKVELKFYDVTGKLIKSISKYFSEGYNSVDVSFENNINGIIYCKMETEDVTNTIKMISIE